MKILIFLILVLVFSCSFAYADLYAVFEGNDCKGTASVDDVSLSDWEKDYTMIKVDESYRGKQGYEIELKDGNPALKTKETIDAYKLQKENEAKASRKQALLNELGITEQQLQKLKGL